MDTRSKRLLSQLRVHREGYRKHAITVAAPSSQRKTAVIKHVETYDRHDVTQKKIKIVRGCSILPRCWIMGGTTRMGRQDESVTAG